MTEDEPFSEKMWNPRKAAKKNMQKGVLRYPRTKRKKKKDHIPSEMEFLISIHLELRKLEFETEKTFEGLVSPITGNELGVDFYIKSLNLIIEYDGLQHFYRMKNEHKNKLYKRKIHDKTKDLYCLQNGIKMLRISVFEQQKYREIIDEYLNKTKNECR